MYQYLNKPIFIIGCRNEFTKLCQEGLDRYDKLIGDEQYEYQKELSKKFNDFRIQLQPMVTTHKKMSHGKKAR